MGVKVI